MKNLLKFCLISFFMMSNIMVFAQPGNGDGGGGTGLEGGDPSPAPINSKLILLAISGVIYALYKFKKIYKKSVI